MICSKIQEIAVSKVELDKNNPRIAQILEMYPHITAEAIALALSNSQDADASGTTIYTLKESIRANGGIIHPIVVDHSNGQYIVIEGNTRVQIYKDFRENNVKGEWETIPAIVYENMDENTKHSIRLQSHLVGPRPWNPYSKAKYLKKLRDEENLPMNQIISLCGGKKGEIIDLITAYCDMEKYYHDKVDDQVFDVNQFSAFRELNGSKKRIDALTAHGFTKEDFGKWIIEGKIGNAINVRRMPEVLNDPHAKEAFLRTNLESAIKLVHVTDTVDLNLPVDKLAQILDNKISSMQFSEICKYMGPSNRDRLDMIECLYENLQTFINAVKKKDEND